MEYLITITRASDGEQVTVDVPLESLDLNSREGQQELAQAFQGALKELDE